MKLTIESKNSFLVQNPDEFIVECRKNKPGWVAEASKREHVTAAVCPSFVVLFKNSFLIKCPTQIDIAFDKEAKISRSLPTRSNWKLRATTLFSKWGLNFPITSV